MTAQIERAPDHDPEGVGRAYLLYTPVDLAALDDEITSAHHWRKNVGLSAYGDPTKASHDDPVVLVVHRKDADEDSVIKAVGKHKPATLSESAPEQVKG